LGDLEVEAEQSIGGAVALGQTLGADGRNTHESNFPSFPEAREAREPEQPWPMVRGEPRDVATFCCDIVRVTHTSEKRNLELQ
jgi:hypothetical protein